MVPIEYKHARAQDTKKLHMDILLSQKIQKKVQNISKVPGKVSFINMEIESIMMSVTIPEVNFLFVVISPCVPVLLDFNSGTYKNNYHVCNWNQDKPEDSIMSNMD